MLGWSILPEFYFRICSRRFHTGKCPDSSDAGGMNVQQTPQSAAKSFPSVGKGFPSVTAALQRQPDQRIKQVDQLKRQ